MRSIRSRLPISARTCALALGPALVALSGCEAGPPPTDDVGEVTQAVSINQTGAGIVYSTQQGPTVSTANGLSVRLLYYGNWTSANSQTLQTRIAQFLTDLSHSKWLNISSLYTDFTQLSAYPAYAVKSATSVPYLKDSTGHNITNVSLTDTNTIVQNFVASQPPGILDNNTFYMVLAGPDVTAPHYCVPRTTDPMSFCGYHNFVGASGLNATYAFVLDPAARCNLCFPVGRLGSATGNNSLDSLSYTLAHEVAEIWNDPLANDTDAWRNPDGQESADLCNDRTPRIRNVSGGVATNLTRNGRNYYLADNWIPLSTGFCGGRWAHKNNLALLLLAQHLVSIWQFTGINSITAMNPPLSYDPVHEQFIGYSDMTGDGNADLVWFDPVTTAVHIWVMVGLSRATILTTPAPGNGWAAIAVGDLNGDGISDILWQNRSLGLVSWWIMNATGTIRSTPPPVNFGVGAALVGVGDMNNDKIADILWSPNGAGNNQYQLWLMLNGAINQPPVPFTFDPWNQAAMGGGYWRSTDHAVIRSTNGLTGIWYNQNGPGTRGVRFQNFSGPIGNDWTFVGSGDLDGNGESDMLFYNNVGQCVSEWYQNDGVFNKIPATICPGNNWLPVALGSDITF